MFRKFLKWLTYTKLWVWVLRNIFAKFTFRWEGYPTFPMEQYFAIIKAIDDDEKANGPGIYAFVSCDRKSLSGIIVRVFSKSFWSHAGMIMGKTHILHMKAEGALYWHILEELRQTDYFAVGRVEVSEMGYTEVFDQSIKILSNLNEYGYDFTMELNDSGKRMYCSELVYKLCEKYATSPNFIPKQEYGRLVFEPDDLYKSMKVIFEYKG